MLGALRIKNLALVPDLTLELRPGYNAITGETGAGKSILIGALNLVLGERADRTSIRSGSDACTVEAVFDLSKLAGELTEFLDQNGIEPCEQNQLTVKRTVTASGANRQFVNGTATSLQVLARLGEWLVDIHGPHEHQSLLQTSRQLALLDAFAGSEPLRREFRDSVRRRAALEQERAALIGDEKTYRQRLDLLRFQVNEIKAAKLRPDEEEGLEADYQRASNSARLFQLASTASGLLSDDEQALLTQAGVLGRTLQELSRIDSAGRPLLELQENAIALWNELQAALTRYQERLELDPLRLQELEERINLIQALKRKYGSTLAIVIDHAAAAQRELESLENRDQELVRLELALDENGRALRQVGERLSRERRKAIPVLSKAVRAELKDLGFAQSQFEIELRTESPENLRRAGENGFDSVEFQFSPNLGEPLRPLRAIASSGEMARVMLAVKTVLAAEDAVPVLVFDEVDANVGGVTAQAVGEKMRKIATRRQVLCITHLAPVAACASAHFLVAKRTEAGRTISEIHELSTSERVDELARMLGGAGEAAKKHAQALLREARE